MQRARRQAEALAGVVREADEPEPTVGSSAHERPRGSAELAAYRRFAPTREPELEVQARREARPLGLEGAVRLDRRPPARPASVAVIGPAQPAHDATQPEESSRATMAVGGGDHHRSLQKSDTEALTRMSR